MKTIRVGNQGRNFNVRRCPVALPCIFGRTTVKFDGQNRQNLAHRVDPSPEVGTIVVKNNSNHGGYVFWGGIYLLSSFPNWLENLPSEKKDDFGVCG